MIDLAPADLATVRRILAAHARECEVRAFGSRATWTAKSHSDLDLALVASGKITPTRLVALREAFQESELPIRVDVVDWHQISDAFRRIIEKSFEVIQEPAAWGMAAEGWTLKSIEELKAPTNGAIAIGPFGSRMKSDCYVPTGVEVIRGTNISDTRVLVGDMVCITPQLADQLGNAIVHADDLVFPHRGSIGLVGIVPRNKTERYALSSSLMKLTCDRKQVEPLFLFYFFRSDAGRHELLKNASTVGTPGIGQPLSSLRSIKVPLPPLAEQKAIAGVLGALDDKIELNRRMNATLEAMARALFQSWFVDFEPVRAKLDARQPPGLDPATAALFPASFQDSPLGHIPSGWSVVPLYDTAQWVNGAAFKSEDFCPAGDGLPVIKIAELKDGIGAQTKWCQRQAGPNQIIDTGDLVYSWSGSPDTSLEAFLWSGGRGLLNQHIFKVISPTPAQKRFVYYLLQYLRPVLVETARNKQTTGLGHVTIADMKRLLVCLPSKEVLTAFDRSVAAIFDRALANTLESRTLATLRDTLLPKLLSGELSVAGKQLSGVTG